MSGHEVSILYDMTLVGRCDLDEVYSSLRFPNDPSVIEMFHALKVARRGRSVSHEHMMHSILLRLDRALSKASEAQP